MSSISPFLSTTHTVDTHPLPKSTLRLPPTQIITPSAADHPTTDLKKISGASAATPQSALASTALLITPTCPSSTFTKDSDSATTTTPSATTSSTTTDQIPPLISASRSASQTPRTPCPTATWRRVQSFITSASSSTFLASALASLESGEGSSCSSSTTTASCSGSDLRWTLSSMLTMFLRSNARAPTEVDLLAMLWIVESWEDARRSPVTLVLGDYLKHLAAFDPERAQSMSSTWRESFCALRSAVVDAQLDLLKALDWNARMDGGAVLLSYRMLFGRFPAAVVGLVGDVESSVFSGTMYDSAAAAAMKSMAVAMAEVEAHAAAAAAVATTRGEGRMWRGDPAGACAPQMNALCARVTTHSSRANSVAARKASVDAKRAAFDAALPSFSSVLQSTTVNNIKYYASPERKRRKICF